jgi:hypothetical protein
MDWQAKTTVKKGNIGEQIINKFLIAKGFIPYFTDVDCPHPFDRLCASKDKKTLFIAESKAKPARVYYPDTGIDKRHYDGYKFIQKKYRIGVFLFFVDEDAGKVYGNFLKRLDNPTTINHRGKIIDYPLEQKGIIYFPLSKMILAGIIPDDELNRLRKYTTRNNAYSEIAKNKL